MAETQSNAASSAHPRAAHPVPDGAPQRGVLHVRHRHTDRFTVVGNHLAQHLRLSATAIGLAVHIQSLPEGACVTAKALTLRFPEGETTIRRALNELEAAGYLVRRRVPLGGGRFATRTFSYDKPGCAPQPPRRESARPHIPAPAAPVTAAAPPPAPTLQPTPAPRREPHTPAARPSPPPPAPAGPAPALLARLRLADPRLLLSARDIERVAPAVDTWLVRAATPAQITRALTANLPPEPVPIHHPARFLEHRLTTHLPPPLPAADPPRPGPPAAPPLVSCRRCERAIRSHRTEAEALCDDCRADLAEAQVVTG